MKTKINRQRRTYYAVITTGPKTQVVRFADISLRNEFVRKYVGPGNASSWTYADLIFNHVATEKELQAMSIRTTRHLLRPRKPITFAAGVAKEATTAPVDDAPTLEDLDRMGKQHAADIEQHAADMAAANEEQASEDSRVRNEANISEMNAYLMDKIRRDDEAKRSVEVGRLIGRIETLMDAAVTTGLIHRYEATVFQVDGPDVSCRSFVA